MNEIGIVFVAEFLRKLRSRMYWFATGAGVLMIGFIVTAPSLFASVLRSSASDVVLAGDAPLRDRARALLETDKDFRIVSTERTLPAHVTLAYLDAHGKAGAAIRVARGAHGLHLDVYARDISVFDTVQFRDLVPLNVELQTGTSEARVARAATIERTLHSLDAKFGDSRSAALAHGVAFGLIFILYLAIVIASQSVMAAVAEEKTSRIAEILVATIAPWNLLIGKTIAAAATALLQIAVWLGAAAVVLPSAAASLSDSAAALKGTGAASAGGVIHAGDILAFATFFVLGYLQYATLYAAAASLVSRTEDLGSVATPVILPVVGAFFVAQYALLEPNGRVVVACSLLPFLSPFVMFTRIAISTVPAWQVALAIAINIVCVAGSFWIAGKIYRVGMLLYGKPPSPKQLLAALRA